MALSMRGTLRIIRQGKTWSQVAGYYFNQRQKSSKGVQEPLSSLAGAAWQPPDWNDDFLDRAVGCTEDKQEKRLKLTPDQPVNPRVLQVAIIGTYNSGKSTLTNGLMGWKVSAASSKIHTTQQNVLAIHTEGDTQIIFRDTPGLIRGSRISPKQRDKLQKSILEDPKKSLVHADLICVMVDASDRWDIEYLDENLYHLLRKNKHIPSVLVLNKIDLVKQTTFLLHITRILTMDTVGGKKIPITTNKVEKGWKVNNIIEAIKTGGKKSKAVKTKLDSLFDRVDQVRGASHKNLHEGSGVETQVFQDEQQKGRHEGQPDRQREGHYDSSIPTQQYTDIGRPDIPEYALKQSIPRGWDCFERVFMISALYGKGVKDLKDFLFSRALPGDWCYHSSVVTDQNPYRLAEKIVWEKMLEHLPKEMPYKYFPVVTLWTMENDVLIIHMNINMFRNKSVEKTIGRQGSTIKMIQRESHAALMDVFRCDIILHLLVRKEEGKNKKKTDFKTTIYNKKDALRNETSKSPEDKLQLKSNRVILE
ncbi:GTPase Era, mitochondrial-like [Pecten maximus]|uniref:GTPase Era, mitochondrial-like n=1 Tax=Pecten maximus TaxID=6579 RepID=UPI0014582630|nr:GTPase Era, mitochondrial-like [Pecten maximus]